MTMIAHRFARIEDGRVVAIEDFDLPDGMDPAILYSPPRFQPCPDEDVGDGWTFDPENGFAPPPAPPPPTLDELAAYARERSWRFETAGIVVAGAPVRTDRESQGLVNGMYALASRDADRVFLFDTPDGSVELSADQAIGLAVAVGNHVQDAFRRRALALADIASGSLIDRDAIDARFV